MPTFAALTVTEEQKTRFIQSAKFVVGGIAAGALAATGFFLFDKLVKQFIDDDDDD